MKHIISLLAITLLIVSCNKKIEDYKQVEIKCGNGDVVLINIPHEMNKHTYHHGFSNIQQIQRVIQHEFDNLKSECNYERTFIPTSIYSWQITDTISYHYIKIEEAIDTIVTLYVTESWVHGIAENAFGVQDNVSQFVTSCYIKDNDWEYCFIDKNDFCKSKEDLQESFETFDLITLKNGKQYSIDILPIEFYVKYN